MASSACRSGRDEQGPEAEGSAFQPETNKLSREDETDLTRILALDLAEASRAEPRFVHDLVTVLEKWIIAHECAPPHDPLRWEHDDLLRKRRHPRRRAG